MTVTNWDVAGITIIGLHWPMREFFLSHLHMTFGRHATRAQLNFFDGLGGGLPSVPGVTEKRTAATDADDGNQKPIFRANELYSI